MSNPVDSSDPAILNARTEYAIAIFDREGNYLGTQGESLPNWRGQPAGLAAVIDGVHRTFSYLGGRISARLLVYVED